MKNLFIKTAALLFLSVSLSGCARDLSSSTYTSDSTLNIVLQGQLLSSRHVKIKESDKDEILSSFGIFYDIRDNNLIGNSTGELYINAYYYLSSNLKNEPVTIEEITKYFEILPVIMSIKGKLNDNNFKGIVITESERDELINLVNYYKAKKVSDSNYQEILNSIIEDIASITNRNSSQIKEFLAN